ncbi:hypothetical protein FQN55_008861 [Onygenales sp. PD_40]|nr:hypothetical protein FQN55_008861 [Onygenales sp. PD_40]
MSSKLWQYFLHDDVDSFKRVLAGAGASSHTQWSGGGWGVINNSNTNNAPAAAAGSVSATAGSPGATTAFLGASPGSFSMSHRSTTTTTTEKPSTSRNTASSLTRADVNVKDQYGRTLLHLIASSEKETAVEFASALLEVPFVDIYAQDLESGWTALHRALYAGNATIAQALIARDVRDATDFRTPGAVHHHPSDGLIKIKDKEGNSPFDVFGATIVSRDINKVADDGDTSDDDGDTASTHSSLHAEAEHYDTGRGNARPLVNILADEVFTFGSNKNLSLGLGDEDDRQFPERIGLTRPDHLLYRFHREHEAVRAGRRGSDTNVAEHAEVESVSEIPVLVRAKPISFQQIVMSKLHTGIVTNDPVSNLFICGFGPGGRLGTGDEVTRFGFVCIETGGLAGKKVVALALGQDHSIAISEQGEVFTWGTNKYGQLGYTLPKTNHKNDVPTQTTPRQIFNPFKKEKIIGAAASSIHSVVFTPTGLYTFGKNEGQLGLIDADARSLESLTVPRRVGASLFSSPIVMVSAIDRATTCLLENHDVWVFTHYGYSKIIFPLDGGSSFIRDSFMSTRYGVWTNYISKITSGGNTICAMSSLGEVYTVNVSRKVDTSSTAASTTNPAKIRNSLPQPSRVWSIKKAHMAVRDVDVGQDGSIIICTESGSAWRKEKRAKMKDIGEKAAGEARVKDYKFVRIPGLSRVVAVRSNAFGAYAVAQRGCDVAREQILVDEKGIWEDFRPLLPFSDMIRDREVDLSSPEARWSVSTPVDVVYGEKVLEPIDVEATIKPSLDESARSDSLQPLVWISTTNSDVRIPVHEFILGARSPVLRRALSDFHQSYYHSVPDTFAIEYDKNGQISLRFSDVDFLSIFNLVLYLYTDQVYDVWIRVRHSTKHAAQYRRVRTEVHKIAGSLELRSLERAARIITPPYRCLPQDLERAFGDPAFFESSDVLIELADGAEVPAHSQVLCTRCPFFQSLFYGRSRGRWLSGRREGFVDGDGDAEVGGAEPIRIDLKHINSEIFGFVLRHIYADTDEELFEDVRCEELEDFVDLVIDVMAVANELMLDRLAQVCQKLLGRFVNTRNVCHYLNAIAPCSVTAFKHAALEYICLNLEAMLENRLLDDLDPDLFYELDDVCRENQTTCLPISRGRNSDDFLVERYPEIVQLIEHDRQRRIDSMKLRSRLHEDEQREGKIRAVSAAGGSGIGMSSPLARKSNPMLVKETEPASPLLKSKPSAGDLIFHMDDENLLNTNTTDLGHSQQMQRDIMRDEEDYREQRDSKPETPPPSMRPLSRTGGADPPKAPWGSVAPSSNTKAGLKDIMAETSGGHPPHPPVMGEGVSTSMPTPRRDAQQSRITTPSSAKLSQKERKKLQQQQAQELLAEQEAAKSKASASPWKIVGNTPPTPMVARVDGKQPQQQQQQQQQTRRNVSMPIRAPSKASMTLRQTVAGGSPSPSPQNDTPSKREESRTVSTPIKPSPRPPTNTDYPRAPHQQPPPHHFPSTPTPARTIHHPRPSYTSSPPPTHFSLASILHEQQSEKDEIREAATAKHKLQDIQLEQEFQEWWDQESRRVREEAEAEAEAANANANSSGARRGGGGRGRGRGGRGAGNSAPALAPGPGPVSAKGKGRADRGRRGGGGAGAATGNISAGLAKANNEQSSSQASAGTADRGRGGGGRGSSRGRGGGGSSGGARGRGKERAVSSS